MLTLTDLFCGAGGSSTGAIAAPGIEVRVASNHWQLAVETHNTNAVTPPAARDIIATVVEALTGERAA